MKTETLPEDVRATLSEALSTGDVPELVLSEARHPLTCGTCGFTSDVGTIAARDAEHREIRGACVIDWYDETAATVLLVRDDADLIRALLR